MTDEQLENAFSEAQEQWLTENPNTSRCLKQQRYFFFAGSEFGVKVTKEIYSESYGGSSVPEMPADLDAMIHAEKG